MNRTNWKLIKTAPKDGTEIIGVHISEWGDRQKTLYGPWTVAFRSGRWQSSWDGVQVIDYMSDFGTDYKTPDSEPTHWIPLPEVVNTDPEGSSRTETAIATMLCKSGKFETGEGTCAFVCMGRLGDVRKDGCSHAKRVHAKLAATIAEGLRAECGYDHGYADGVEWATCHAAVAETNAAASGNTSLVSGASSEQTSPEHSDEG